MGHTTSLPSTRDAACSRPQRAQCDSIYTDMRNISAMVYRTVGLLGVPLLSKRFVDVMYQNRKMPNII